MKTDVRIHDGLARISLSGRFYFNGNRTFRDAYTPLLNDPAIREIEIDQVEYMDSSSLSMLLLLNERAQASGKKISMLRTSAPLTRLLDTVNFSKIFHIKDKT